MPAKKTKRGASSATTTRGGRSSVKKARQSDDDTNIEGIEINPNDDSMDVSISSASGKDRDNSSDQSDVDDTNGHDDGLVGIDPDAPEVPETRGTAGEDDGDEEGADDGSYVVEKVLDKRKRGGRYEYFIKWEGYESSDNTWEPLSNLDSCPGLIEEYERSVKKDVAASSGTTAGTGGTSSSKRGTSSRRGSAATASSASVVDMTPRSKRQAASSVVADDFEDISELDVTPTSSKTTVTKERTSTRKAVTAGNGSTSSTVGDELSAIGFDRGLKPEKVMGATEEDGELLLLVKWKGSPDADLVPSKIANVKCPQLVIEFYQEKLKWRG